jgi:hypothetical protein
MLATYFNWPGRAFAGNSAQGFSQVQWSCGKGAKIEVSRQKKRAAPEEAAL